MQSDAEPKEVRFLPRTREPAARPPLARELRRDWILYVMVLPGIVYLIIFRAVPLAGSLIAFQDYSVFKGFWGSTWVGLKHFSRLFRYENFYLVLRNTVVLGILSVLFSFPVPILLSLMLNEVRVLPIKKTVQNILYLPHFLSWVIIAGLAFQLLSLKGVYNTIRGWFGLDAVLLIQERGFFRPLIIMTGIWRDAGWGTIIYLAAIAGINPELYEAAIIDGANKIQRMFRITLPCIMPTVIVLFLIRIGHFLNLGFEHIYNFLTPMTYSVGDIIDTYVYRVGVTEGKFSFTTAVGIFQSLVGFILIMLFNWLSKRIDPEGGVW